MLEKRRPAGDEVTAESLNESTDLDSLLSAILGDRADGRHDLRKLRRSDSLKSNVCSCLKSSGRS